MSTTTNQTAEMSPHSQQIASGVFEVQHPLIECHLTALRDATTSPLSFRAHVRRLATLLAYEATQDLSIEMVPVTTPLTKTTGGKLAQRIGLIPILRAGLGMVDPVLDLIPTAEVWHLGLYRDEDTAQPVEYYSKLPPDHPVDVALVVDPMLATGGSMLAALETLKKWGVGQVKLLSIIASEEGIKHVETEYPDTQIYVCKIDPELNDVKYIVPGLGDAGDRIFNTLH
ncbi:uracil phosphoribosyltransferase [Aeoliella sp. ICT_H6.2]|uniref:Uracil phosphoribosyltransferase n=1 Tax=Aeoliella straminimaris TaxID=2954799 RepID=A0A9X2FDC0_9BACT|nr:uracil phosphoribosyltransferase [Aeoliella straminimaris]MCO6045997.1 uracil phosphoribosyltransferase [Aeoliella straminimaris]